MSCRICANDRQYVGWGGQKWTTLEELRREGRKNIITTLQKGIHQIVTKPSFAIDQRALLVELEEGNLLWDCIAYIDEETISRIKALGGIKRIAISHPHFYSTIVEWSRGFGDAPVYVHHSDEKWLQRQSESVVLWRGKELSLGSDAKVLNLGGHFPGSSVLHLEGRFEGGVLLSGDTVYVVMDRRWASFMYSYPNLIPLPASKVKEIAQRLKPYRFQNLYSGFAEREILGGADAAVQRSAQRYIRHLKRWRA